MVSPDKFQSISMKAVLTREMKAIWDSISLGVIVVDTDGNCVYMNKLQRNIDGFEKMHIQGQHISKFYIPHKFATLATLLCLESGKPMLKQIYWYKTTTNKFINSVNDLIPLFDNGNIDGVISFSFIYGLPSMAGEPQLPEVPRTKYVQTPLYSFDSIVGRASLLQKGVDIARAAAKTSSHVMIWGESGSGKELFAQAIHGEGIRKDKAFIPINCAAVPENLLEGFMFGTSKGAFTDATDRAGLFENANGGTLLLDEINSMPLGLQAKLLRAIQESKIRRVGSPKEIPIDVRIVSILNEHPLKAVEKGTLRSDLYYRLAVVGISVPPLRERKEDILYLADHFIRTSKFVTAGITVRLSDEVCSMFITYNWPGNIRELQHVIEGSLTMLDGGEWIGPEHLPEQFVEAYYRKNLNKDDVWQGAAVLEVARQDSVKFPQGYYDYADIGDNNVPMALKSCMLEYERNCIMNVLRFTGGNVAKAARVLKMKPAALHYRINLLGLG